MQKHEIFDDGEEPDLHEEGGDPLQGFTRLDAETASDSSVTWPSVGVGIVGLLVAVLLLALSYSSFQRADQLREWANDTWVVSGDYSNMTNALESTAFNPMYKVTLPQDPEISDQQFNSGMGDPISPAPGQAVEVRGTDVGSAADDFEQSVDVVLGVEDGMLQVLDTEKQDSLDGAVTDRSVSQQQVKGWLLAAGSLIALAIGVVGAMWLRRRDRL
ncbi:MAG: hypothetical protein Q4C81_07215 [Kocuria sp.]|nr:hypothetical protein [Kocuria sp.]